jgi:hypothetical protein
MHLQACICMPIASSMPAAGPTCIIISTDSNRVLLSLPASLMPAYAQGGGYTSTCSNGAWLAAVPCGDVAECDFAYVPGCANHYPWCYGAPPYAVPGAAWDGCDKESWPAFTDCNATCVEPATGEGYSAECNGMGGWYPLQGSGCAPP